MIGSGLMDFLIGLVALGLIVIVFLISRKGDASS